MTRAITSMPQLGFGLGLRPPHYPHIFEHWPQVDWFEVISENFMDTDGRPKRNLARIRERYPVVMHGVALSIGTVDPLNSEYLHKLKALIQWLKPAWISDHLCWTGVAHRNTHDLLPVPYTEEALAHIVQRIREVQDFLEHPIALENPSTYLEFKSSSMPEAEFIARMAEASNCRLLLDVNNVYVTCFNHRLDPKAYLDTLPMDRVVQIHLSGHSNKGTHIIDTHDDYVVDDVWTLYKYVVHRMNRTPNTMVEWDAQIPEFDVLYAELEKAKTAAATAGDYSTLPDLAAPRSAGIANEDATLVFDQARMQEAIILRAESDPDAWIRSKEKFLPEAQLGVYIDAYRYRLYDVVAEDYPVLAHYMGVEDFKSLVWDFVNIVPSDHFNIGRYATKLSDFITQRNSQDKLAQEICALETTLSQLADAEEVSPLAPEDLSELTPERLMQSVLLPRAAVQLMAFTHPVNDYYCNVMEKKNPAAPAPSASWLAVLRKDDVMWRMALEESEYRMLKMLFDGMTVGAALEALQTELKDEEGALAAKLSEWFARWMKHQLLARIERVAMQQAV